MPCATLELIDCVHLGGNLWEVLMTVYLKADVKVTDDSWVPEYASKVHDLVAKHGGKYLSRSGNINTIEGEGLDTTLIA